LSVTRREVEKVGHWGTREVGMRRFRVTPSIDVTFHHATRIINVVTIETGAMIFVLMDDLEVTNRRAISFTTTGYARCSGSIPPSVEIGFLCPQAHDN